MKCEARMNTTSPSTRADEARLNTPSRSARTQPRFNLGITPGTVIAQTILLLYAIIALFPIYMIVINSFKAKKDIFGSPFAFPTPATFDLVGYRTVLERANFGTYFMNSLIVTVSALVLALLIGSMAAFALSEYDFKGNKLLGLYLSF